MNKVTCKDWKVILGAESDPWFMPARKQRLQSYNYKELGSAKGLNEALDKCP